MQKSLTLEKMNKEKTNTKLRLVCMTVIIDMGDYMKYFYLWKLLSAALH